MAASLSEIRVPIKLNFELEVFEDGFPPISVETMNARLVSKDIAEIDNTPFFVEGIASGDIVYCAKTKVDGIYDFAGLRESRGKKAISIIFVDLSVKDQVYEFFENLGCYFEYGEIGRLRMLAVEVRKSIDYCIISRFLDRLELSGRISYAELCIQ